MILRWSRSLIPLLIILILPAIELRAQAPEWTDVSGRPGFSQISELADGTLFGRYGDILYRSYDGGVTWDDFLRPAGPILEYATGRDFIVLVVFIQDDRVFSNRQFFLSTDRGETWERIFAERNFPNSDIHQNVMVSDAGEIYTLEYSSMRVTVQRYTRGRWEPVGNPTSVIAGPYTAPFTSSIIDGTGTFYIGSLTDGIHSSRDNGETWTKALPYRLISSIEASPDGQVFVSSEPNGRTNGGVYRSADRGLTWQGAGLINTTVHDLAVDSSGNLLAASSSGIFRYAGEMSWDALGPFDFAYDVLHVTKSKISIATAPDLGMLISSDAGLHWELDGVRKQDVYTVCGAADGSLLAGTLGEGIFRSTDGGYLWKQHHGAGIPAYFYSFTRHGGRIFAGAESGLYRSDDNGVSWVFLTEELNPPDATLPVYAVGIAQDGTLFIGTGSGVYVSGDDGASWSGAGLGSSRVQGLHRTTGGVLYAATATDGIFSSSDDGLNWRGLGVVRTDVQSMAVSDAGHVVVGIYGGIYRSTDGGSTWSWRNFTGGHVYALLYNGNFQIFAATSDGMFVSDNDGEDWARAGLPGQFVVSIAYDRDHAMLAGVFKGGVHATTGIITGVADQDLLPAAPRLYQNYPNPFNPRTTIAYEVARASDVSVTVFDQLGRETAVLFSGRLEAGVHTAVWDASGAPSGVYYYRVRIIPGDERFAGFASATSGSLEEIRKMVLVK